VSPIPFVLAVAIFPTWSASAVKSNPAAPPVTYSLPLMAPPTVQITVPFVISELERLDRGLQTLAADFTQHVRWDDSGMSQTVEGSIEFKKPELMRLQHVVPEPQTLVSDGSILWVHRPSTEQVIKSRLSDWKKSEPLAQGLLDFGNYAGLLRRYDVSVSSQGAPDASGHRSVELRLAPREKTAAQDFTLTLRLSTKDYFPAEARLRAGNVSVRSIFSNIKYNAPIPEERFRFAPPPGADVFDNVKPSKAK
jgi:outer membrane lipoprotein carrier protein